MIVPATRSIARIPHLNAFLGEEHVVIVGWGAKPSGARARAMAQKAGVRWMLLEDGFLRSVERNAPPLSLMVDDLGIYYDANAPSRLETLIRETLSPEQNARVRALMGAWRAGRVSKYNHAPEYGGDLPARFVLVVDQTFGDVSIRCGMADASSFMRMLEAALRENPECTIIVKVHPDVFSHKKRGYFDMNQIRQMPRVQVLSDDCHPVRLIEEAKAVYAVTSQMGFEGLLWGKRVRCFAMPFYAGWGLTEDEMPSPSRRGLATLEQLVHAALVACPRYIDPETGLRCDAEKVLAHVSVQREIRAHLPREIQRSLPWWRRIFGSLLYPWSHW